jgi:hypothetical protein
MMRGGLKAAIVMAVITVLIAALLTALTRAADVVCFPIANLASSPPNRVFTNEDV